MSSVPSSPSPPLDANLQSFLSRFGPPMPTLGSPDARVSGVAGQTLDPAIPQQGASSAKGIVCEVIKRSLTQTAMRCIGVVLAVLILGNPIGIVGGLAIAFTASILSISIDILGTLLTVSQKSYNMALAMSSLCLIANLALFIFAYPAAAAHAVGSLGLGAISFGATSGILWLSLIPMCLTACLTECISKSCGCGSNPQQSA